MVKVYLIAFGVAEGAREIDETKPLAAEIDRVYTRPADAPKGPVKYFGADNEKELQGDAAPEGIKPDSLLFISSAQRK